MARGMVAENIRVRRSAGVASRISSSSSRKPMSSISSASSRTTAFKALRSSAPRSRWSRRRPGVPTTIWAPPCKRAAFLHRIHSADAGDDPRASVGIEPLELLRDLDRQFASRGDDEAERFARPRHTITVEHLVGNGDSEGDRLARPSAGGDDEIAAGGVGFDDGGLDGGEAVIAARGQRSGERGGKLIMRHGARPTRKTRRAIGGDNNMLA